MTSMDTEKAFTPYTDDEHATAKVAVDLPYMKRLQKQRSRWFSWKTALLTLIIVALLIARLVEGLARAHWHEHHAGHQNGHPIPTTHYVKPSYKGTQAHGKDVPAQVTESTDPVSAAWSKVPDVVFLNDPADPEVDANAAAVGVSIAASIDLDNNRQVYDLDSDGVLRVRKLAHDSFRYTSPETIPTNQKPRADSPLTAISWREDGDSLGYRLFYISANKRVIELAGTSTNATEPTKWTVKTVFGTEAAGGLAALNIGPRYDPKTLAGQLRVLFTDSTGAIRHYNNIDDKWYIGYTGFTGVLGADVAINAMRDNKTGQVTDISTIYVDPKEGLKEFVCDEKNNRNQYFPARPVDPSFSTKTPGHFAAAFGGPPPSSRIYTLTDKAAVERTGTRAGWYTTEWWTTVDNSWFTPAAAGGSVAAVAWNITDARVFYKTKYLGGKLAEIGVTAQVGDGVKWFPRGYIN